MTIADKLASAFGDGTVWETESGMRLVEQLSLHATETKFDGFTVHRFADGSGIVTYDEWGTWSTLAEALENGLALSEAAATSDADAYRIQRQER